MRPDAETASAGGGPEVSVLIPCYNEERHLARCLDTLIDDYVLARGEILVIDGKSRDLTRQVVAEYQARYPVIRLLDNPHGRQAFGLNIGIEQAAGAIIVRADAHSTYPTGYVRHCVELLRRTGAANVGGVMAPEGQGAFQEAVAAAMMHPAGIGGAKFRWGTYTGYTDTVYLGTFHRSTLVELGGFDPRAHPTEDAELNLRLLKRQGAVFLDGSLRVTYQPRQTFADLLKQFFHYGRGRCYVVLKHRKLLVPARLLPPLLVAGLLASLVLALLHHPAWLGVVAFYLLAVVAAAALIGRGRPDRFRHLPMLAAVLMAMHLAYGAGFLAKLLRLVD